MTRTDNTLPARAAPATPVVPVVSADAGAGASPGLRLMLLLTMALWGGNVSVVKLLNVSVEPLVVSGARMVVAALALVAVLRWRRLSWQRLDRGQVLALAGCAVLMVYGNQLCFANGVQNTSAANSALILSLNPLVSTLLAALLLGDRLTPARLAGLVLGFGGVAAVVLHRPGVALGQAGLGDALMFGAVLTWSAGGLVVQRLARRIDSAIISTVVTAGGGLLLVLHLLIDPGTTWPEPARLDAWFLPLLLVSGVLSTGLGALVWNHALVVQGVARTSLYAYWVPIFGVAVAVLLLGEPLSVWHGVGLAGVLAGTWLGTRRT